MVSVRAWGAFIVGDRSASRRPTVQQVQDMGLGLGDGLQRQFDGGEHSLFVMLENQGQNLDHLAVAAWRLKHALL